MEKMLALLGFNGQWCDPITEGYPLGAGRRTYSTERMRFDSDDPTSPFGKGGPHPSAYCEGDPINRYDPTGEAFLFIALARRFTSFAFKNFGRARNFAISGVSRNPDPMSGETLKRYRFAQGLTGLRTPTLAKPIPMKPRLSAPQQKVKPTEISAPTSTLAPPQSTQTPPSALTQGIHKELVLNRPGYGRRDSSNFAAKTTFFALAFLGGGAAALYFGLKAIRKN
ncbi:hypothetical protein BL240_07205 [Pseudomonas putida]|uniref:RHS repeat-associated core domain-containing protein n=2 Tax=Pseudomonas putida TaxID=303 RepID=A0A1L5PM21_PSEPU|nr:hypothetical protein BL240_07205 [Pseudomonas putida]